MSDNTAAIRLVSVSKSFGKLHVLDNVSFSVNPGSALCILGPSGTGKSVTLKLMIGLLKPEAGEVLVNGQEITRLNGRELSPIRKKMGFLFQNAALFDSISVGKNVAFPLQRHTNLGEAEIRERAEAGLKQVGLTDVYDRMPSELSGGMKKRASLARAMALNPSILLVDEPSAGLDPITSAEVDELLLSVKRDKGAALVVVTHNIPSAKRLGDELVMLNRGEIALRGTPEEFENSEDATVKRFMSALHGG
jgi:phospholipid/cholesterol/gamma-HCH transport system ATP-binding protein